MASVADDETNVVLAGELDGGRDVSRGGDVHGVVDVVAELTRTVFGGPGVTGLVRKEGLHNGGGGLQVRLGQSPVGLQRRTGSGIIGRGMAGSTNGHSRDETTSNGAVQRGPGGGGGPAVVTGQTVTLGRDSRGGQSHERSPPSLHDCGGEV